MADAIFLRRPIRTRRPRFEQRIRRPRGTGQGPRRQRQRRHGGSRPGCEILRLHPARPAYAAQAPHPQRTARPLARSAARGLQPSGLGDRPERDVTKRRDATAEAPADSRTKPPTTVLRRTKKSRHREMPGSSLCAKRKTTPLPPRPSWRYRRSPRRRPPPNARSASRRPHAPRREAPWYP